MQRGMYIGPFDHLQGATALLKGFVEGRVRKNSKLVLAQFDDTQLTRSGAPAAPDQPNEDMLGFGWHTFARSDFLVEPDAK